MNLGECSAIITGANSGIGRAIAEALAEHGASTLIAGRRTERNEETCSAIRERYGTDSAAITTDVSREEDCEQLVQAALDRFGRLDILINNAGIGSQGAIENTTSEEFDRVLKTNLYGSFWCARAAFRAMRTRDGGGAIINLSSLAGVDAWWGTGTYSASKFGIMGLTKAMADEGKDRNIRCAAICPALVASPMSGVEGEYYLQPGDVAETVLWLLRLSPAAWPTEVVLPRRGAE